MNCGEWRQRLWEGLDGELGQEEAHALSRHLSACPGCRAYAGRAAGLHEAVPAALSREAPDLAGPVLRRIREAAGRADEVPAWAWPAAVAAAAAAAGAAMLLGAELPDAGALARELCRLRWDLAGWTALPAGLLEDVLAVKRSAETVPGWWAAAGAAAVAAMALADSPADGEREANHG